MSIKLVALDLDHTLLNSNREISKEDLNAIVKARKRGVIFTIATGRMFAATKKYAKELQIDVPIITYQGSLIKRLISEEEIRHLRIGLDITKDCIRIAQEHNIFINVYNGDDLYVLYENELIKRYKRVNGVNAIIDSNLLNKIDFDPTKVVFVEDDYDKLSNFQSLIKHKYGKVFDITRSLPHLLELGHLDATKSNALAYIAKMLNIKQENTMAIGDGLNDLDMINWAQIGVAMENANELLKHSADWITLDNNNSGVAKAIKKYILEAR